jgi:hypothetical protein
MNLTIILLVALLVAFSIAIVVYLVLRYRPKKLDADLFQDQWKQLQKLLRDKAQWPTAIIEADTLLDMALKKKKLRGRSMGERMVKAQRLFTDNDSVWFGHKLRSKIDAEPDVKLKETEVKQALVGIRQGLKDIGALPNGQPGNKK